MIHEIRENGREVAQAYPRVKALIPIRQAGEWVYVSGHGPEDINTYEPLYRGRVGEALTLAQGRQAAAECGKTLLRAIQERYGTLDCIAGLVRALILVNCRTSARWRTASPTCAWRCSRSGAAMCAR